MIEYYKNKSLESLFYVNENGLVCQEEWKDIPDYEGLYQASDLGRIKSLSRYVKNLHGLYLIKDRILAQAKSKYYLSVNLSKEGIAVCFEIQILMGITFLNHIPDGTNRLVVDHDNNIQTDNRLVNLQIITHRNNSSKDKKNGTSVFTGVYFHQTHKKWNSAIKINKKTYHLGAFINEIDASNAYQLALKNWEEKGELPPKKVFSSKYKGVTFRPTTNNWGAKIKINGKLKHIGVYKTELEASNAFQDMLLKNPGATA